ncbi:hypothetical protein AB0C80_18440 [Streptomyces anthocyanicus]|uniref:hypothetical protein n=1 Tax=Streptomyces anthocyanicus TaxID=68174 RepID=UPI0034056C56
MSGIDWGDAPTWLGAVFAAGAAWAAWRTLASQRAQIREQRQFIGEQSANLALEREELRAAAAARREAQAKCVQMNARKAGGLPNLDGQIFNHDHWEVRVRNSSDAPIHDVDIRFGTAYLPGEVFEIPGVAFEGPNPGERTSRPVHLLGPGRALRFLSQRWSSTVVHNNRPTLSFNDNAGVRWTLDSRGKLEEAPPEPQA